MCIRRRRRVSIKGRKKASPLFEQSLWTIRFSSRVKKGNSKNFGKGLQAFVWTGKTGREAALKIGGGHMVGHDQKNLLEVEDHGARIQDSNSYNLRGKKTRERKAAK